MYEDVLEIVGLIIILLVVALVFVALFKMLSPHPRDHSPSPSYSRMSANKKAQLFFDSDKNPFTIQAEVLTVYYIAFSDTPLGKSLPFFNRLYAAACFALYPSLEQQRITFNDIHQSLINISYGEIRCGKEYESCLFLKNEQYLLHRLAIHTQVLTMHANYPTAEHIIAPHIMQQDSIIAGVDTALNESCSHLFYDIAYYTVTERIKEKRFSDNILTFNHSVIKSSVYSNYLTQNAHFINLCCYCIDDYLEGIDSGNAFLCFRDVIRQIIIYMRHPDQQNKTALWNNDTNFTKLVNLTLSNICFDMLSNGEYHIAPGRVNPIYFQGLIAMYDKCMEYAVSSGEITGADRKEQHDYLMKCIAEAG